MRFWKIILFPQCNFLRHYKEGKTQSLEKKSLIQERTGSIKIYRISFERHSNEYDFINSNSVIYNFLTNVQSRFVPIPNGMVKIKCSFSMINTQSPTDGFDVPFSSLKYRLTEAHKTKHFKILFILVLGMTKKESNDKCREGKLLEVFTFQYV